MVEQKDHLRGGNGWQEYQRLVLHELASLRQDLSNLERGQGDIKVELGMLKVKSGLWGLLGGFVPVAIAVIMRFIGE
jgi:hypothetical protein